RALWFRLGSATLPALTGDDGQATVTFPLQQTPGDYTLSVSFEGDAAYTASFDTRAFTLHKQPTTLTLSPAAVTMQEGTSASVQATLLDSFDASVRHKS